MRAGWLLLLVVCALTVVSGAAADGDPASDVLLGADQYTPYPAPSSKAANALGDAISAASTNGDHIKVAVIATRSDLGSVPSLFGQPRQYARFLGTELTIFYKGAVLVVRPAGFGFASGGKAVPAADAVLAHLSVDDKSTDGLALAAAGAV